MKYLLSILSFLLLLTTVTIGFSQNMSEKEWKKRMVGKTLVGHGISLTFNKNGSMNGTYTNNGKINQVRGSWTYTKSKGYCRNLTIIFGDGRILERGNACQKSKFKGNGKVEINNQLFTLK